MKFFKTIHMLPLSVLALLICSFLTSPSLEAQDEKADQKTATIEKEVDPGKKEAGIRKEAKERIKPEPIPRIFEFPSELSTRSMSATTTGDITRVDETDRYGNPGLTATIERVDKGVKVKLTRWVGRDDWNEFNDDIPGVAEYAESVPQTASGFELEVRVGVSKSFEADSMDSFSKKYPTIYRHYYSFLRKAVDIGDIKLRGLELRGPAKEFDGRGVPPIPVRAPIADKALLGNALGKMKIAIEQEVLALESDLAMMESQKLKAIDNLGDGHTAVKMIDEKIRTKKLKLESRIERLRFVERAADARKLDALPIPALPPPVKRPATKK